MTPRLFMPVAFAAGATVDLDPASAHHAIRVLRLKAGAVVELFDGGGHAAIATVASTDPCRVTVQRLLMPESPAALRLTLAQCISAADKMDWTIEKAVELGVAAVVPLQSQKAIVKLNPERSARRREHWQRLILAASAQSGRNRVPRLDDVSKLEDWLRQPAIAAGCGDTGRLRLILDPRAQASLTALLSSCERRAAQQNADPLEPPADARGPGEIQLLCGPESGFSDQEFAQACAAGWAPVRLGPRMLRTETAALAALAVVQARWGDLR